MVAAAPRLDARVLRRLESLASEATSVAEIRRALVVTSREIGVAPPSYEHVRRLVIERRAIIAEARDADVLPLIVDVALGVQHGNELVRVARGGRARRRR